jgi:hypothetical protein
LVVREDGACLLVLCLHWCFVLVIVAGCCR